MFSILKSYIKPNKLFLDLSPHIDKPSKQPSYPNSHKFVNIFLGSVVCIKTKFAIILSNLKLLGYGIGY